MKNRDLPRFQMFAGVLRLTSATLCVAVVGALASCSGPVSEDTPSKSLAGPGQIDDQVLVVQSGGAPQDTGGLEAPGIGSEVVQIEAAGSPSSTVQVYTGDVQSSMVSLQVKDLEQLRNSILTCFGTDGLTLLKKDMFERNDFITNDEEQEFTEAGKKRIFSSIALYSSRYTTVVDAISEEPVSNSTNTDPDSSSANNVTAVRFKNADGTPVDSLDVVALEAKNLNDLSGASSKSVASDEVSDRYLRSLELVGQVVAHNCSLDSEKCDCTTEDSALAMIQRCLPTLESETTEIQSVARAMAAQCSSSAFDHRKALAALISSYAFSARR